MKTLNFLVTVEVPNKSEDLEIYKSVRDAVFNLDFKSATILPYNPKLSVDFPIKKKNAT